MGDKMTASTLRQPMPCPWTYAEYERARPHMIDTAGRVEKFRARRAAATPKAKK